MTHQHQLPYLLTDELAFPDVDLALDEPNGLLAVGGDLTSERLLLAYQQGIFPWYSAPDPIIWWSPDPRAVLYLEEMKVSRSLAKSLRNKNYDVWLNKDFSKVIQHCSEGRKYAEGTWITDEMIQAYNLLHDQGDAHCISVYHENQLVGGLYGLSKGKFFFGESMFSRKSDASKVALYFLVQYLIKADFLMVDCQVPNAHLTSLGSRNIRREEFIDQLNQWISWSHPDKFWVPKNLTEIIC